METKVGLHLFLRKRVEIKSTTLRLTTLLLQSLLDTYDCMLTVTCLITEIISMSGSYIVLSKLKIHGGHVEAETLDVRSLKAGKIDANRISVENDKVKLDSRGVTVSDADFLLKDAYTDSIYSVVPRSNLIPDHSFEFMTPMGTVPDADSTFTIQYSPFWKQLGAPRLEIDTGDYTNRPHLFGSKAIKVNSSHWVRGVLEAPTIAQGRTYTFSAFARCASDGGKLVQGYPNIRIQFADKNGKSTYRDDRTPICTNKVRRFN